jgi:hypothetical protein
MDSRRTWRLSDNDQDDHRIPDYLAERFAEAAAKQLANTTTHRCQH